MADPFGAGDAGVRRYVRRDFLHQDWTILDSLHSGASEGMRDLLNLTCVVKIPCVENCTRRRGLNSHAGCVDYHSFRTASRDRSDWNGAFKREELV